MTDYETKKQARIDYYRKQAEKAVKASESLHEEARRMASVIPFGQPILVGHHSEKGDRRYRDRIGKKFDKSFQEQKKAEYYEQRAESAERNHSVSSDDPEAVQKLAAKIAEAEAEQERMKAVNKAFKKNDTEALHSLGFTDEGIGQIKKQVEEAYSFHKQPFPSYALTNNNANIRRLKERLMILEKQEQKETTSKEYEGFEVVENVEENRIQILFPGKPSENIRTILKSHGFRWSPYNKAWQRHLNGSGRYAVEQVIKLIKKET